MSRLTPNNKDSLLKKSLESLHTCAELSVHSLRSKEDQLFSDEELNNKDSSDQQESSQLLKGTEEKEEYVAIGSVPFSVYGKFFVLGAGWLTALLLFMSLITGQVLMTMSDYWLAEWAQGENQRRSNMTITVKYYIKHDPDQNLYVFLALSLMAVFMNIFRTEYFYIVMVRCSRRLHNLMFKAVLKAPMYFFNTNPVGQVLNRFSRDIGSMDDELTWVTSDFHILVLLTLAIVGLNIYNVPFLAVIIVPLAVGFLLLRRYYLRSSRQIKRLEATSRSPLFTHVSATLAGMVTLRSFGLQDVVLNEFYACLNYQLEGWLMSIHGCRWFAQKMDAIAAAFAMCAMFAPLVAASYVDIDPGLVGVSLTYVLNLCGMFQWMVRQSAEVDNLMTSVERVFEYAELEPEEDKGDNKDLRPTWPEHGAITCEDVCFKYHSMLSSVLKNLCFNISSTEKVGIVGRTGAGKSSLLQMLFRMGNTSGKVMIDGIDISNLKLKDLRKVISVIPQDPVMFSGTLRKNLDPFNDYTDSDIWQALEEVQMKEAVMEMSNKLLTEIKESGSNCSVGQRQLLCLARALLRKNKILMVDEATANVDLETDSLIQSTIREKFSQCTVLTIAHRLNTVMDSNRVMVMDSGTMVEFDEPHELLQNPTGHFRKLVDQTGSNEASRLELLAEEAAKLRRSVAAHDVCKALSSITHF